jgi:hypothetical protein
MDLSLVGKLPPPQTEAVRFVYPRETNHLKKIQMVLITFTAILIMTRRLYLRRWTTQPLLWDDCTCKFLGCRKVQGWLTQVDLFLWSLVNSKIRTGAEGTLLNFYSSE